MAGQGAREPHPDGGRLDPVTHRVVCAPSFRDSVGIVLVISLSSLYMPIQKGVTAVNLVKSSVAILLVA